MSRFPDTSPAGGSIAKQTRRRREVSRPLLQIQSRLILRDDFYVMTVSSRVQPQ